MFKNYTKSQILAMLGDKNKSGELAALILNMQKEIRSNKTKTESTAGDLGKAGFAPGAFDPETIGKIPIDETEKINDILEQTARLGAAFAIDGPLSKGLANTAKQLNLMLGDPNLGGQAFKSLIENLQGFGQMSRSHGLAVDNFTEKLGTQAAVLKQLGLNMGQFQQNVDTAIYSFGMGSKEVQKLNLDLVKLADQFNMLPGTVSRNFNLVAKNLAYDSETIKEQFAKMQKLSLQTGVGVGTIQSKFGRSMDTISGASQAAASINALLGTNAVSATQLLMMPDAERAEFVRGLLKDNQPLMSSLKAGGAEGKFALQTAAEVLNMDVDTTRRFIDTGEREGAGEESVKAQISKQAGTDFSKASGPFKNGLGDLTNALAEAVRRIKTTQMTPEEQFVIDERAARIRQGRSGQGQGAVDVQVQQEAQITEKYGDTHQMGFSGGPGTSRRILSVFPGRGGLFLRGLSMGAIPKDKATAVEKAISSGNNEEAIKIMTDSLQDVRTGPQATRFASQTTLTQRQAHLGQTDDPTRRHFLQQYAVAPRASGPGTTGPRLGPKIGGAGSPGIPTQRRRTFSGDRGSEVERIDDGNSTTIIFKINETVLEKAILNEVGRQVRAEQGKTVPE